MDYKPTAKQVQQSLDFTKNLLNPTDEKGCKAFHTTYMKYDWIVFDKDKRPKFKSQWNFCPACGMPLYKLKEEIEKLQEKLGQEVQS